MEPRTAHPLPADAVIEAHLLVRPSGYTVSNDGKHAEFLVNFCVPAADSQAQVALYFTNGNAMCGTFQK